jgi:hypothetical protein
MQARTIGGAKRRARFNTGAPASVATQAPPPALLGAAKRSSAAPEFVLHAVRALAWQGCEGLSPEALRQAKHDVGDAEVKCCCLYLKTAAAAF